MSYISSRNRLNMSLTAKKLTLNPLGGETDMNNIKQCSSYVAENVKH